jgi:hypothetical protein
MSIGIDPLIEDYKKYSHNILNSYTFIYDCVIDIDEKDKLFYVTSAKDCSSLYKFNEKITNDETNTIDFYLPENRMKDSCTVIDKRIVGSKTLENIFDLHKIEVLHILKVDAQGNDLNVIKSAEKYLDRILFIVMESNSEDTTTLYKDSTTFHEDHTYLISHNFKLLGKEVLLRDDYDCIYYNAKLIIN